MVFKAFRKNKDTAPENPANLPPELTPEELAWENHYRDVGRGLALETLLGGLYAVLKSNGIDADSLLRDVSRQAISGMQYIPPADNPNAPSPIDAVQRGIDTTIGNVVYRGNRLSGLAKLGSSIESPEQTD